MLRINQVSLLLPLDTEILNQQEEHLKCLNLQSEGSDQWVQLIWVCCWVFYVCWVFYQLYAWMICWVEWFGDFLLVPVADQNLLVSDG